MFLYSSIFDVAASRFSFISSNLFLHSFLLSSFSLNVFRRSDFIILFSSNFDIVSCISVFTVLSRLLKFSLFISIVFIFSLFSYFTSVFSSTFFFFSSIFFSSSVSLLEISFSFASFSSSSFANFSLFAIKLSFLLVLFSFSSCISLFLVSNSSISFKYVSRFWRLFAILSFWTFISEFICSIFFSLSNPKFCVSSIFAITSSNSFLRFSFKFWSTESLLSSSVFWEFITSISFINSSSFVLYVSILYRNSPISIDFSSSLKLKYFFAFSDWFFSGSIFASISDKISLILSRFSFVCSNFFSDSFFLALYFTIPAASSNIFLLSSDLLLKISSILPCPIIEYPSLPIPVSINSSSTSFNLHGVLFIKYPLSPFLKILLVTTTSPNSIGSFPSELSITIEASAKPKDFLLCVPAKIMSSDLLPLKDFILCSPRTHLILSEILLLPDPFGPITVVIPGINSNTVLSAKDLNPCNSNLFKYI